jgi:glutamate-1-semialdehyde 2,1-aminomutase
MLTQTNHKQTFRFVPSTSVPVDPKRVEDILKQEWELFTKGTGKSAEESRRSFKALPLGVTSSFQHWDPYPISIASAKGAYMTDVDGRQLLDLSMGFGAMLAGHLNPIVVEEIENSLTSGMLFVTPSPISTDAAERICNRFGIDQVRFTNSGTESTMYAVRVARSATEKMGILKVEGGYHGSYDPFVVSSKPALDKIGDPEDPIPAIDSNLVPGDIYVVPFNNIPALERMFEKNAGKIACFIVEPVLENLAIVLPDEGYLEQVRELCDQYNVVLIFDEVKTGLTAGAHGASVRLGVQPDLITLAKSIGGGVPLAAFGGKKKVHGLCNQRKNGPLSVHFNGNPLNRGIITPPGLDEQWLISLAHGQTEIDLLVEDFRDFAKALRA